ncbi:methyl-accepting chemotaxis protein [Limnobacter humi]|uniref:Methyl-accepting chemotaxis protein n=1 Tax=Limnobacter humi TaxID=1778671 RepID=A0ABT1WC18_9BURK|nr:methyl-accepting chemotaxis protein [Limnobacter humi]MCQ8895065.1 methyl-accepting chemotaxis protein [Limnobacter humi]
MPFTLPKALNSWRLQSKFVLIAAPCALAVATLFGLLINEQMKLVNTTREELAGVALVPQWYALQNSLQDHRESIQLNSMGAVSQHAAGDTAVAVDQALQALLAAMPTDWAETPKRLDALKTRWKSRQTGENAQAFQDLSALLSDEMGLIRWSADDSTMTFDPEVSTYYLISALNFDLPQLHEQVDLVRSRMVNLIGRGEADDVLAGEIGARMLMIRQLGSNLVLSFQKVESAGVPLDAKLREQLKDYPARETALHTLAGSINQALGASTMASINQQVQPLQSLLDEVAVQSSTLLRQALQQRIERLQKNIAMELGLAALICSMALTLALAVFRKVNRDVACVLTQSQRLSAFNLVNSPVLQQHDELGQISAAIETVRHSQATAIANISALTTQLNDNTRTLENTTGHIHQNAADQADSSASVASSIEELSVSVGQVAEHAEAAKHLANQTGESSRHGLHTVGAARQAMQGIGESTSLLAQDMDRLGERTDRISIIVQTIHDIAEQTNLLALNAAIEAARAGEQGRGFAVVADEVRKLSERTAQATQDISSLVESIQSETLAAVNKVKGWNNEIADGMAKSDQAEQAMQGINSQSLQACESVMEIHAALAEQTVASQTIARQIERIAQGTEEAQTAVAALTQVASEVNGLSTHLNRLVGQYQLG